MNLARILGSRFTNNLDNSLDELVLDMGIILLEQ